MSTIKKEIKKKIETKNNLVNDLEFEIEKLIQTVYPEYYRMFNTIGDWDCKDSPIGLCIYDHMIDQCLDNCLFCGQPDERK